VLHLSGVVAPRKGPTERLPGAIGAVGQVQGAPPPILGRGQSSSDGHRGVAGIAVLPPPWGAPTTNVPQGPQILAICPPSRNVAYLRLGRKDVVVVVVVVWLMCVSCVSVGG
jgi:hypothetical protein